MTDVLHEGRPIEVASERERIGSGPWARLFATAVAPDEGSSTAERGRQLARAAEVHTVVVAEGELSCEVEEHTATIAAEPVPVRIWAAVARSAERSPALAAAVEGQAQSVQLEHTMTIDWEEPLVPVGRALSRSCTCGRDACEHVAALGYAIASEIDRDASLLLRWRGCVERTREEPDPAPEPTPAGDWTSTTPLPEPRPLRPLPAGAVLKRLGPSVLKADPDLNDVLQ
ncbi:MAG: hypothetical protein M3R12_00515, partial [Actinomycetota bacterium]|nr:hypothetical protein [Actinomycetota bacterium]